MRVSEGLDTYVIRFWRKHSLYTLDAARFLDFNREWIEEKEAAYPGVSAGLRRIALEVLTSENPAWIRKALSALAVVAHQEDTTAIAHLRGHVDAQVQKDVGTCLYEIRRRAR